MALAAICVSCGGPPDAPPEDDLDPAPEIETSCAAQMEWDLDGDSISDATEINNRDAGYHAFDPQVCDDDPSVALGVFTDGSLDGGINLKDLGSGYRHLRGTDGVDEDDWGTLPLLNCLEAVGRAATAAGLQITVNDLSLRQGGFFPPHHSHQNGLDVDLRYAGVAGFDGPLDIAARPDLYDPVATQVVMAAFVEHCSVAAIFVDTAALGFTNAQLGADVLFDAPGHSNHFHVRVNPR